MTEIYKRQLEKEEADRRVMLDALNETKRVVELRRNFLSLLAREVKEPLQFINTELRKPELTQKNRCEMKSASRYVLEIIRNMTEYERIEQGKIRIENHSFSLEKLMQDLLKEWKQKAKNIGIDLKSHMDIRWDEHYGDMMHFRQVVDNIIGNCLMNSEVGGTLYIHGEVQEREHGVNFFSMVFEDKGIPIEEEYFGREYPIDKINKRVDWKREEGTQYTTFSLMLARRMTELLSGTMLLHRKKENINVIKLEVPFQREIKETVVSIDLPEEQLPKEDMFAAYHIFVVGRDDADSDLTGACLRVNGAVVDVAHRGEEALRRWKNYEGDPFDAILLEGYLPDMEYLEFVRKFRQIKKGITIPIFVMVDDIRQESIYASMKGGVNGFLKKPLNLKRFQQMLDMYYQPL